MIAAVLLLRHLLSGARSQTAPRSRICLPGFLRLGWRVSARPDISCLIPCSRVSPVSRHKPHPAGSLNLYGYHEPLTHYAHLRPNLPRNQINIVMSSISRTDFVRRTKRVRDPIDSLGALLPPAIPRRLGKFQTRWPLETYMVT